MQSLAAVPERASRSELTALCKSIYARGPRLTLQQTLTTVYRPVYGAMDRVLPWVPAGARLLDVGCGTAPLLFLANAVRGLERGWGIDTKQASIDVARGVAVDGPLEFECRDRATTERIAEADTITLIDLLHHVPADSKVPLLEHYLGHARPGTRIIVKDLDVRPRWRALANRVTDFLSTRSLVHYVSMGDTRAIMEGLDVEIVHADRWTNYVWIEYLLVGTKRAPRG